LRKDVSLGKDLKTMTLILPVDDTSLARACALLHEGKLVAFPTETVYGLGADATNGKAVAALYEAKGRPSFNPLIIHVLDVSALQSIIVWNETARLLATSFWPGALTLILPRHKDATISLLAGAGLDTVAVRIPSHPTAQKLLRMVGVPLAAPSANASGKLSPTTPAHVAASLGDKIDLILAGGRSQIGLESTVVDVTRDKAVILRPGGITQEQLERVLGYDLQSGGGSAEKSSSPGMLASHYAPHLPVRLNALSAEANEAYLAFGPTLTKSGAYQLNLSVNGDLSEAAANLFFMLRECDRSNYAGIAVAPIPEQGLGVAINDRLKRAATR
jgi:L-threonylcarbamoyladenylate synthase